MSAGPVYIKSTGGICAVGIGVPQIAASVRAGISRLSETSICNREFEPMRLALLPEDALAPLTPELDSQPLTARLRRLLRLASTALQEVARSLAEISSAPLFLALPEPLPISPQLLPWLSEAFLPLVQKQSGIPFAIHRSRAFPVGRAGGLVALEQALALLSQGSADTVIVGGVDSYLDLMLLGILDQEQRLLGRTALDGFIPGEGAAFIALTRVAPPKDQRPRTAVLAAGSALDPGHRYGSEPARGEGLASALECMRAGLDAGAARIRCAWAGLNGESFGAKEWGVSQIRHSELFDPVLQVAHPADCYGDLGAATGTMLLALADHALRFDHRPGPMLVWASSDSEPVACAYVNKVDF